MDDFYMTLLVSGESKVGKTTLGATAPGYILNLDSEAGGGRFVKAAKTTWNPLVDPPPEADGSWKVCSVALNGTAELDAAKRWLQAGQHPFNSVVVDSISKYQSRLKRELAPNRRMEQGDWGDILVRIEDLVMELVDCVARQPQLQMMVLISGTRFRDGKFRPMLDGAMAGKLPYELDVFGAMTRVPNPEGGSDVHLRVVSDGVVDAGNRVGDDLLGGHVLVNPHLETLYNSVKERMEGAA